MFLVGDLGDRGYYKGCGIVKVKSQISNEDLGKAKQAGEAGWQVINLTDLTFFDAENNKWVKFDSDI